MRIIQLSDTHLTATGVDAFGHDHLKKLLGEVANISDVDAVIVAGDCSDDGSLESYEIVRDLIEPFATDRRARVIYAMGNHDQRANFREVLGNGHGAVASGTAEEPINAASYIGGMRIITVDTTVPGQPFGILDSDTIAWLVQELATPAPEGTVLVMHHPPVAAEAAIFDHIMLDNPDDLATVLEGSDVRLICSGHYHHQLFDSFRNIPVVVSPGVLAQTDLAVARGCHRELARYGALVIDITPSGMRQFAISGGDGLILQEITAAQVEDLGRKFSADKKENHG